MSQSTKKVVQKSTRSLSATPRATPRTFSRGSGKSTVSTKTQTPPPLELKPYCDRQQEVATENAPDLTLFGNPAPRRDVRSVIPVAKSVPKLSPKVKQKTSCSVYASAKEYKYHSGSRPKEYEEDLSLELSGLSDRSERISREIPGTSKVSTNQSIVRRNSGGSAGSYRSRTSAYSPRNVNSRSSSRKSSLGVIKDEPRQILKALERPNSSDSSPGVPPIRADRTAASSVSSSRRTTPGESPHMSSSQSFDLSSESITASPSQHSGLSAETARTYVSSSSSCYMSWVDNSLNSEFFSNATSDTEVEGEDADGEWGHFWRNYNSSVNSFRQNNLHNRNATKACKTVVIRNCVPVTKETNCETHDESDNKTDNYSITLTSDQAEEAANCAQRLADILKSAIIKTPDNAKERAPNSKMQSFRNKPKIIKSFSFPELFSINFPRVTADELQQQRMKLKPVRVEHVVDVGIRRSGVLDIANILQSALRKRRDVLMPVEDIICNTTRSDWSVAD